MQVAHLKKWSIFVGNLKILPIVVSYMNVCNVQNLVVPLALFHATQLFDEKSDKFRWLQCAIILKIVLYSFFSDGTYWIVYSKNNESILGE